MVLTKIRIAALGTGALLVLALVIAVFPVLGKSALNGSVGSNNSAAPSLSNLGVAPDFTGIVDWENSASLTMASLRGKVVLIDFWTYSCINCQRTFPYLRQWWNTYHSKGLVIVGVHSPEFDFEKDVNNIRHALTEYGVVWPVAVDSNMATWNAYKNLYWPGEYLIDKTGVIRHTHFGEGEYDVTEAAIRTLLAEGGGTVTATPAITTSSPLSGQNITGETYVGSSRSDGSTNFQGSWDVQPDYVMSTAGGPSTYAQLPFQATQAMTVVGPLSGTVRVDVTLDGANLNSTNAGGDVHIDPSGLSYIVVDRYDLYHLVRLSSYGRHTLRLSPEAAGFQLYTFVFG